MSFRNKQLLLTLGLNEATFADNFISHNKHTHTHTHTHTHREKIKQNKTHGLVLLGDTQFLDETVKDSVISDEIK